jgi:hypothetical protein
MSIKLTEKQLELLITAIHTRINELNGLITPLLAELKDHEAFIQQHDRSQLTQLSKFEITKNFELLPWSKKIIQVLLECGKFMTTNEIVAEIVNRVPALAEETSTRSSVASILSRRSGKLFKKTDDKYGLIEWGKSKL